MQQQRGGAEKKKLKNRKRKLQLKRCCFGFTLIDGVHGIVVWDCLYALFVITTSLSTVFYYADQNQASQAFTDICSAALLIVRAIYGMWTCCKHFEFAIIRKYFIIRAVWDVALLIVNCIMVGLRMMPVQTFFLNGLMLFIVDGYLNLAIWSYMQHLIQKAQLIIKKESNENLAQIDFLKQLNQVEVLELAADNERCSITSIQQLNQENISARNDDNQNQQIQMNEIDLDLRNQVGINKDIMFGQSSQRPANQDDKQILDSQNPLHNENGQIIEMDRREHPSTRKKSNNNLVDQEQQQYKNLQIRQQQSTQVNENTNCQQFNNTGNIFSHNYQQKCEDNDENNSSFVINYQQKKQQIQKPIRKGKKENKQLLQQQQQKSNSNYNEQQHRSKSQKQQFDQMQNQIPATTNNKALAAIQQIQEIVKPLYKGNSESELPNFQRGVIQTLTNLRTRISNHIKKNSHHSVPSNQSQKSGQ
eukprot:403358457